MVAEPDQDLNNNPLEAYVALLRSKGASTKDINLRKHFLRHLTSALKDKTISGEYYRETVDEVLRNFPDDEVSQSIFKTAAREYYNFWIGDVKSLVKLNNANIFEPNPVHIAAQGTLTDLLAQMDADGEWVCPDTPALERYLSQLYTNGLSQAAIDVRERLLRLLLYVSREHESSPKVYRAAVEALLPLFSTSEGQQVFVQLAREYYYFWIQDPSAEARIGEAASIGPNRQVIF
jgi:hypothetical protein